MERRLLINYSERLKSLGHPTRLQIALLLIERSHSVNEICEKLKVPQATISQHLAILRHKGIVIGDRNGTTINYGLVSQATKERLTSIRSEIYETASTASFVQDSKGITAVGLI